MKLPEVVYKPRFAITRASHVVIRVRDLQASRAFYVDILGFVVSDERRDDIWLRGLEEGCHHSLVLKRGDPACERFGMRVLTEEDLELAKAHFSSAGFPTEWVKVEHQGSTFHTVDPAGTNLEFCATMETRPRLFHHWKPIAGREFSARSRANPYPTGRRVSGVLRCAWDSGFQNTSSLPTAKTPSSFFFSAKATLTTSFSPKSDGPRIHHFAYTVPETVQLMTAADLLVRADMADQVEFGPARHFSPGLPASSTFAIRTATGSNYFRATTRRSTSRMSQSAGKRPIF